MPPKESGWSGVLFAGRVDHNKKETTSPLHESIVTVARARVPKPESPSGTRRRAPAQYATHDQAAGPSDWTLVSAGPADPSHSGRGELICTSKNRYAVTTDCGETRSRWVGEWMEP